MKVTLAVDVELGKCVEQSNIIHVVAEKAEMGGDRPKCNQGRVKYAVGKNPTTVRFPAEGDVSQVRVKGLDGLICARCLRVMQSEEAAKRAPVEAPPAEKPARAQGRIPRGQGHILAVREEESLLGPHGEGGGSPGRAR